MSPVPSPLPTDGPLVVGRILLYADDIVAGWMSQQTGVRINPPYTAFASLSANGQIAGAVLFNAYQEQQCEVSIVAPRAVSRGLLRVAAQYAYGDLRCKRVVARTRASSLAVRRFIERVGFQQEGVLRSYYRDGDDAILYGMLETECKWW